MVKGRKYFSADETATFCSQTAMMLNGGISLYEGMNMLAEEMEDSSAKGVLGEIDERLKEGSTFSDALKETGAFPVYMVQMSEVGERTGKLEDVMKAMANYYEREHAVNSGIKSVIFYPFMLLTMLAVILTFLVIRILPMFEAVFNELDNRTSGTKAMMTTSVTVSRIAAAVVLVIVLILAVVLLIYRNKKGAKELGKIVNHLPFAGKISERLGKDRFIAVLTVLIGSGMETGEAVERASELPEDARTLIMAKEAKRLVAEDAPLDNVLCDSGILSGMEGRMLSIGIKSGAVDKVLEGISDRHDEDLTEKLSSLSAGIEVALVLFLTVLVGAILISVMMPLISVIASI